VAVVLSAQATDKSVNLATRKLFPPRRRRSSSSAFQTSKTIQTIGLFRTRRRTWSRSGDGVLKEHGGEVPRGREGSRRLPGVGRAPPTWC
jgi:endonuclease-3